MRDKAALDWVRGRERLAVGSRKWGWRPLRGAGPALGGGCWAPPGALQWGQLGGGDTALREAGQRGSGEGATKGASCGSVFRPPWEAGRAGMALTKPTQDPQQRLYPRSHAHTRSDCHSHVSPNAKGPKLARGDRAGCPAAPQMSSKPGGHPHRPVMGPGRGLGNARGGLPLSSSLNSSRTFANVSSSSPGFTAVFKS